MLQADHPSAALLAPWRAARVLTHHVRWRAVPVSVSMPGSKLCHLRPQRRTALLGRWHCAAVQVGAGAVQLEQFWIY